MSANKRPRALTPGAPHAQPQPRPSVEAQARRAEALTQLKAERDRFRALTDMVRSILAEQPSAATVCAAASNISRIILQIADEVAKGRPC